MVNSGGKSRFGAVGAAGLNRIGMKKARALESDLTDRADPTKMKYLQLFTDATKPDEGDWIETHPGEHFRPRRGHVLARRHRPYEGCPLEIPHTALNRYDDAKQLVPFTIVAIGEGVAAIKVGDVALALSFAGTPAQLLGTDLVLLKTPEYECKATDRDLSSDIVYDGPEVEQDRILERLPEGKVRVRRRPNRHWEPRAWADGCECGGEIAAVIEL